MNYNFTSVFCLQFEEQQFGRDTCGRNLPQLAREQEGGGGGWGRIRAIRELQLARSIVDRSPGEFASMVIKTNTESVESSFLFLI